MGGPAGGGLISIAAAATSGSSGTATAGASRCVKQTGLQPAPARACRPHVRAPRCRRTRAEPAEPRSQSGSPAPCRRRPGRPASGSHGSRTSCRRQLAVAGKAPPHLVSSIACLSQRTRWHAVVGPTMYHCRACSCWRWAAGRCCPRRRLHPGGPRHWGMNRARENRSRLQLRRVARRPGVPWAGVPYALGGAAAVVATSKCMQWDSQGN